MEVICHFCKKPFIFKEGKVHFERSKTHACSRKCQNVKHGLARDNDKRYNIWCNVKKRCKKSGMQFTLKHTDIPEIPEVCPVLGIKIKANTISAPLDSSPSLDRIDTTRGYVIGNIRIISNRANRIKSDATLEELILILKDAKLNEKI